MTETRAKEIVGALLHNVQKARSDITEFFDEFNRFERWSPEAIERIKADMHRWLFGKQGEGFVLLLGEIAAGRKKLDPLCLYNLLFITHRLEPTIGIVGQLRGWDLPEPDVEWLKGWETEQ